MSARLVGREALYHLAAVYKLWLKDRELIYRVNIEGTTSTLLAAQAAGVKRIVYTSSIAAVGLVEGSETAVPGAASLTRPPASTSSTSRTTTS